MPLEPITTVLEKIYELTPTVRTFRLRFPAGKWISFKAGQFCMVQVPHEGGIKKKAYSICSAPHEEGYLDLCVKLVEGGLATNWFWTLKEQDAVTLTLPYGNFVLQSDELISGEKIFIATGTGLAPLRSMILNALHQGCKSPLTLIFGVRYEDEIFYGSEFWELEKRHSNFRFIPTVSRPKNPKSWQGEVGYVQAALKKYFPDSSHKKIYLCGLVPMIEAVEQAALELGFDKKQIHYEKYV